MDVKDKKILYELDLDSRKPFNQIGRQVKLSPETTRNRFLKLVERKVIFKSMAVINSVALGYSVYEIYIKLKKMTSASRVHLIRFLQDNKKVAWVGEFDGSYDMGIILIVKSPIDLKEFLEDMSMRFGSIIMKKTMAVNLKVEFMPRDYLVEKSRKSYKAKTYKVEKKENIELDDTDMSICRHLAMDARASTVGLSQKIGISADSVALRIRKLSEKNIITGYTIVLDNSQVGQSHYKVLFYLSDHSEKAINSLLEMVRLNNRVLSIVQTLSEWDYEVDLEVESYEQIRAFLNDLTNMFSEKIRDYDLLRITGMPKYNFLP